MVNSVYAVEDPADLDVEKAAFEIWPLLAGTDNALLRREYAAALADIIGAPGEFHKYVRGNAGDLSARRARLIEVFRENFLLLIGKTWVDRRDERRKASTLDTLDAFTAAFGTGEYGRAMERFASLAADLALLLFGESPEDPGFMDYVFRIDPRLGVFYWYVAQLAVQGPVDPDLAQLQLLVAVYSLASF